MPVPNDPATSGSLTSCPHCDLLLRRGWTPANHTTSCPRCGYVLGRNHSGSLNKSFALSITGLLLYFPSILLPLITLEKLGMKEQANVIDTIIRFYSNGYYFVSAMTLLSAVVLPACLLGLAFIITLMLQTGRAAPRAARLFRHYVHFEEWAMLEVYLFGILVTIFKMADTADIAYNAGFFSFIALVFITLGMTVVMDKNLFWEMLDCENDSRPEAALQAAQAEGRGNDLTAAQAGMVSCLTCSKLDMLEDIHGQGHAVCSRCGDRLHLRKPHSLSRTLALVMTSALLLLPANLLPIMRVDFLGVSEDSTILDGILHFLESGSYLIGLIIMIASILVPLFKIISPIR